MPARKVGKYFPQGNSPMKRVRMRASQYREKQLRVFAQFPHVVMGRPRLVRLVFVKAVRDDGKSTINAWLTRSFFRYNFSKREIGTRRRTAHSLSNYRWTSVQVLDHGWQVGAYKGEYRDTELGGNLWKHLEYARVDLEIAELAHANYLMTQAGGQYGSAP